MGSGDNMAWRKWDRAHDDWSGGSALGRVDEQAVQLPDPVGGEAAGAAGADARCKTSVLRCKTVCYVARRWAALQHGALLRDPVMPVIPGQAMPHEHSANMRRIEPVGTRCGPTGCTSAAARWRRALALWSASVRCRGASAAARRALSAQCVHEVEWPCAVPLQYP